MKRPSIGRTAHSSCCSTLAVIIAIFAALAPSPSFAETHALQPYAYVQSYGVNAVDTGCYATKTTKYFIDFEYTSLSAKKGLMGASQTGGANHIIYNARTSAAGSKTTDLSCVAMNKSANGHIAASVGTRYISTLNLSAKTLTTTNYNTRAYFGTVTVTGTTDGSDMTIPTYLFAVNNSTDAETVTLSTGEPPVYAKIYSFEMDSPTSPGTPAAFFAPTTDASGNAGYTNIVAGTFHGEVSPTATNALTFTDGIGNATDYKYEDSTFYAKFHAYANDTDMGGVAFGSDAASGTAEAWVARGATTTLTAVPATGYVFIGWTGDTWAIVEGNTATASITVKSGTAIQLLAEFAPAPTLTLSSSASWSTGSWLSGSDSVSAPASGWAKVVASSSATLTLDADVALDGLIVECSGGATLTIAKAANATCSATEIVANGNVSLDIPSGTGLSCGTLTFAENATLTADSDVRGLGAAAVSGSLDLAGHTLAVAGHGGTGALTSSVAGGVLNVDTDSVVTNSAVALSGGSNLQVLKTGTGTLVMCAASAGFGGEGCTSVVVRAGVVQQGAKASATCGAVASRIVVEDGAQFDMGGTGNASIYYDFTIAGSGPDGLGAITSSTTVSGPYNTSHIVRNVDLAADATIGSADKIGLKCGDWLATTVNMNGFTLSYKGDMVYLGNATYVGEGTIDALSVLATYKHNMAAPDCDVFIRNDYNMHSASGVSAAFTSVRSLVFDTDATMTTIDTTADKTNPSTTTNFVTQLYAPCYGDKVSFKLGDATHLTPTLDLSRLTETCPATNIIFQSGATVSVALGERKLRIPQGGAKLLAWAAAPENVTFVSAEGESEKRRFAFVAKADGLYAFAGFTVIVK